LLNPTERTIGADEKKVPARAFHASRFSSREMREILGFLCGCETQGSVLGQDETKPRAGLDSQVRRNTQKKDGQSECRESLVPRRFARP
jgi:hypothetical protein